MSLCCAAAHKPTGRCLFSRASLAGGRQSGRRSPLFLKCPPPLPLFRASPIFIKKNNASESGSLMARTMTTTTTRAMMDSSSFTARSHPHFLMTREGSDVGVFNNRINNDSSKTNKNSSRSQRRSRRRRSLIDQRAAPVNVDDGGNNSKNGTDDEEKREAELKDVYQGPTRSAGGLRRHSILVYVADETGMINRVAGVFARRGYNIDSLCVGLNEDKAIFTIMVVSDDNSIAKLIKQLNKLAKVRKVENVTDKECVDRGLLLVKVKSDSSTRTELL